MARDYVQRGIHRQRITPSDHNPSANQLLVSDFLQEVPLVLLNTAIAGKKTDEQSVVVQRGHGAMTQA